MASSTVPAFTIGIGVSPAAVRVIEVLADYTSFPHLLLVSVCERQGRDVGTLAYDEVPALIQPIALQIAAFNDVEAAFEAKRRLVLVGRSATGR